jgi:putative ABC transport system substrate-binding protein
MVLRRCTRIIIICALLTSWSHASMATPNSTVAIVGPLGLPSVARLLEGLQTTLANHAGGPISYVLHDTTHDVQKVEAIAKELATVHPHIIIALTTPVAKGLQALAMHDSQEDPVIPMLFADVPDPVTEGLVPHLDRTQGYITGISSPSLAHMQMHFIKQLLPNSTMLGVCVNPQDPEMFATIKRMQQEAAAFGLVVRTFPVRTPRGCLVHAKHTANQLHAFFMIEDAVLSPALPELVKLAKKTRLPVFANYAAAVKQGALLTVTVDPYQVGVQLGERTQNVLQGQHPGNLGVLQPTAISITVNQHVAKELDITIPASISQLATKVE